VYIGRGPIKRRLSSPERADWTFDVVEYSLVADPDEQVKWEYRWIERFKEEHGGQMPIYNKISGSARLSDKQDAGVAEQRGRRRRAPNESNRQPPTISF
jgi:hypothetical protein